MHQKSILHIENFFNKSNTVKHEIIALSYVVLFLLIGYFEGTLKLPKGDYGLFQHTNIWVFFISNIIVPIAFYLLNKSSKMNLGCELHRKFTSEFNSNADKNLSKIILQTAVLCGFIIFVGNALQDAKLVNHLPFDFFGSIEHKASYIADRLYKLYFFSYFIPYVSVYTFNLVITLSSLLIIEYKDCFPIENYVQLNELCNFGLEAMIITLSPIVLSSIGTVIGHRRFDITTFTNVTIAITSSALFIILYFILIRRFHNDVKQYKNTNLKAINQELASIHKYILEFSPKCENSKELDICLKREVYLCKTRESIERLTTFPKIFAMILTGLTPMLPTLLSVLISILKNLT